MPTGWEDRAVRYDDPLTKRHRQTAHVALLHLRVWRALQSATAINSDYPEVLCVAAIRVNDERKRAPCSIHVVAKMTGLPWSSAKRYLDRLVKKGVLQKQGDGYVGCTDYLRVRVDAPHFERIKRYIKTCAAMLGKFD
jgi:hypothetical protein